MSRQTFTKLADGSYLLSGSGNAHRSAVINTMDMHYDDDHHFIPNFYHLECPQGSATTAKTMRDAMADIFEIRPESREIFEIWAVSKFAQIQLKDDQLPFEVVDDWDHVVHNIYGNSNHGALFNPHEHEDPHPAAHQAFLYFKRNSLVDKNTEKEILNSSDEKATELLYKELAHMIIYQSAYPHWPRERTAKAAALALAIEKGSSANVDQDLTSVWEAECPMHMHNSCSASKWITLVNDALQKLPHQQNANEARGQYLKLGWDDPMYGCEFFFGEIEPSADQKRGIFSLMSHASTHVRFGINHEGLYVFDHKRHRQMVEHSAVFFQSQAEGGARVSVISEFATHLEGEGGEEAPDYGDSHSRYFAYKHGDKTSVIWTQQGQFVVDLINRHMHQVVKGGSFSGAGVKAYEAPTAGVNVAEATDAELAALDKAGQHFLAKYDLATSMV